MSPGSHQPAEASKQKRINPVARNVVLFKAQIQRRAPGRVRGTSFTWENRNLKVHGSGK